MRKTINAAIINNGRILLVRKKQSWLLPGGKPEPNESDLACLCREVCEELSGTQLDNIRYYGDFIGNTHIQERFRIKVYFADIRGELRPPSAEILEYNWAIDTNQYNLSDVTSKVIDSLRRDGHLKPVS